MPNASLGKVMLSPICMSCIRVLNVWTALFNINGKFCKYTGNVVCTYL